MSRKKARRPRESRPAIEVRQVEHPSAAASVPVPRAWAGWLWGFLIVAATLGAYWPALRGDFVFDDLIWTTGVEKLLRDSSGLWEIWTNPTALQQYYPVTGTSFWLDYQLWHWWTLPYHVENVLLHVACALLALETASETGGAGGLAGGRALRPASGNGGVHRLDHRAQERALDVPFPRGPAGLWTIHFVLEGGGKFEPPWLVLCAGPGAVCWRAALEDHGLCAARGASAVVLVEARAHSLEGGRAADPAVLRALHWSGPRGGLAGEASCGGAGRRLGSELAGTHPGGRPGAVVLCWEAALAVSPDA